MRDHGRQDMRAGSADEAKQGCLHARGAPGELDLRVVLRAEDDPWVLAARATACRYDFGPSGLEHITSAVLLLCMVGWGWAP